jgi:hypothetical protein
MKAYTLKQLKPVTTKLKLSHEELKTFYAFMARIDFLPDRIKLDNIIIIRALIEFMIKKRLEYQRKLLGMKRQYTISLNAIDSFFIIALLTKIETSNEWERNIIRRVCSEINRMNA